MALGKENDCKILLSTLDTLFFASPLLCVFHEFRNFQMLNLMDAKIKEGQITHLQLSGKL
jgi:hypothetical protein